MRTGWTAVLVAMALGGCAKTEKSGSDKVTELVKSHNSVARPTSIVCWLRPTTITPSVIEVLS